MLWYAVIFYNGFFLHPLIDFFNTSFASEIFLVSVNQAVLQGLVLNSGSYGPQNFQTDVIETPQFSNVF